MAAKLKNLEPSNLGSLGRQVRQTKRDRARSLFSLVKINRTFGPGLPRSRAGVEMNVRVKGL
jgi:hypothetical protein